MTYIPVYNWDDPICEKHNFRGHGCFGCQMEEREEYAKQKSLDFIDFIKTKEFERNVVENWESLRDEYPLAYTDEELYELFLIDLNKGK